MLIHTIPSGPFETNAYVLGCPHTKEALIIDPAPESYERIKAYLTKEQLQPKQIILTHSHWDHIGDVAKLKHFYHIPVSIHPLDQPNLENPGSDGLPLFIEIEGVAPDRLLAEGNIIECGDLKFEVIHTPGHSPGSICLHSAAKKILISGDTLFKGSIGNLSFPTSQPKLMWGSLDKLAKLPHDTQVYPGHGPSTTIGSESWLPNAEQYFS